MGFKNFDFGLKRTCCTSSSSVTFNKLFKSAVVSCFSVEYLLSVLPSIIVDRETDAISFVSMVAKGKELALFSSWVIEVLEFFVKKKLFFK